MSSKPGFYFEFFEGSIFWNIYWISNKKQLIKILQEMETSPVEEIESLFMIFHLLELLMKGDFAVFIYYSSFKMISQLANNTVWQ